MWKKDKGLQPDWKECTTLCSIQNSEQHSLQFVKLICGQLIIGISAKHKMYLIKRAKFVFRWHNKEHTELQQNLWNNLCDT
jgi:hypothetical protein